MCWPGTNGRGSGSAKKKLLIRGVCGTIAVTAAGRHSSFAAAACDTASVSRVTLLLPGIAVHVVAAQLPEPRLVALGELQAVQPLRRLPEIEMRDEQAGGTAVLGRDRLALVRDRDHPAPADKVLRRHIGRIAVDRMGENVGRRRLDAGVGEEIVDRDPLPRRVELAPLRDAMD